MELPEPWGKNQDSVIEWSLVKTREDAKRWYAKYCPMYSEVIVEKLLDVELEKLRAYSQKGAQVGQTVGITENDKTDEQSLIKFSALEECLIRDRLNKLKGKLHLSKLVT